MNSFSALMVSLFIQVTISLAQQKDTLAENMLAYQRSAGGWPKAVNNVKVDYMKPLSDVERKKIAADSLNTDATFDNKATSREIIYLTKAAKETGNSEYLNAAEKGISFILAAQYPNGGWPQYFPDKRFYRGQITYNDDAMVHTLNILQDISERKNGFDIFTPKFGTQAENAVDKAVECILATQIIVNGTLTAWCAQYDEQTMKPAKARAYELPSLSGSESVGIVKFLIRLKNPSAKTKTAIKSAMDWFEAVKISGYKFELVRDAGNDLTKPVVSAHPNSIIWARFYEIGTNKPFFSGRDGVKKYSVNEIDVERGGGYAWYGTWPAKLFAKDYPDWKKNYDN